jgi:hypothetical protein
LKNGMTDVYESNRRGAAQRWTAGDGMQRLFARWLVAHGWRIMPAYDYNGIDGDKAPRLYGPKGDLILPDLLCAKRGRAVWCEVKFKSSAFLAREIGQFVTGINEWHFQNYLRVSNETGLTCFIVLIHERENVVKCDSLRSLSGSTRGLWMKEQTSCRGPRYDMRNWKLDRLTSIATFDDLSRPVDCPTFEFPKEE